jgi:hypothetical protein
MLSKTPASDPDESRILEALEADTPIHNVQIDEPDTPASYSFPSPPPHSQSERDNTRCRKSRKFTLWASAFAVGIILVPTLLTVLLPDTNSKSLVEKFAEKSIPRYSREAAERNAESPQAKALAFINATFNSTHSVSRLRQRYSLAVLYFSVISGDLRNASIIMDRNECNWFWSSEIDIILNAPQWGGYRNICDDDNRYLVLVLHGSNFKGTIPSELEMLGDLQYLMFRGSNIHGTIPTEM